jgi:hypothetical protein
MTISYPIYLPSAPVPRDTSFRLRNAVGLARSPFTYETQVVAHQGQAWQAEVRLPRMGAAAAAPWTSFFTKLRGRFGTFYLGDWDRRTPRGTAAGSPMASAFGSPSSEFNLAGQRSLYVTGWDAPTGPTANHVLFAPFDGLDGATSAPDLSPSSPTHVLTFNGGAVLDAAERRIGTASLLLDGSGDYVSIPDSADWLPSGEFTAHCRFRLTELPPFGTSFTLLAQYDRGTDERCWKIGVENLTGVATVFGLSSSNGTLGGVTSIRGVTEARPNEWNHIAYTIDGTTTARIALNGRIEAASSSGLTFHDSSAAFTIGCDLVSGSPSLLHNGNIDQVEVVNGAALWTANFTPPDPFVLKEGDYIQFNDGIRQRLHMVVRDASPDEDGMAILDIEPALRANVPDGTAIVTSNCKGTFRLLANDPGWDSDFVPRYTFSFACEEVI